MDDNERMALWIELERRLLAAYEVAAQLDDREQGPRQFAACVLATEIRHRAEICGNVRLSLSVGPIGCVGRGGEA